jgi:hypothetical protein
MEIDGGQMMNIDWYAFAVAVSLFLAGLSKLLFAYSQRGRKQAYVLPWLSIPFLVVSVVYFHAAYSWPPIEEMKIYARWGFIAIGLSTAIVLTTLSVLQIGGGKHGKF